jgi:hypothetical protein
MIERFYRVFALPSYLLHRFLTDYDVFLSPLSDFKKEMMASSQSLDKGQEEGGDAVGKEGGEEVIWYVLPSYLPNCPQGGCRMSRLTSACSFPRRLTGQVGARGEV